MDSPESHIDDAGQNDDGDGVHVEAILKAIEFYKTRLLSKGYSSLIINKK